MPECAFQASAVVNQHPRLMQKGQHNMSLTTQSPRATATLHYPAVCLGLDASFAYAHSAAVSRSASVMLFSCAVVSMDCSSEKGMVAWDR